MNSNQKNTKFESAQAALSFLLAKVSDPKDSAVQEAGLLLENVLLDKTPQFSDAKKNQGKELLNILQVLQDVLLANDHQFLKRQQTYHVSASAALPLVYAEDKQLRLALDRLISHVSSRVRIGGRIEIGAAGSQAHGTPGVEIVISGKDPRLKKMDRSEYLRRIYSLDSKEGEGGVLVTCRQLIATQHGQSWCDIIKNRIVEHHVFLPEQAKQLGAQEKPAQTYRYDIGIRNFANLRKSFGIKKSALIVSQVENVVRSLIRYPLDMVVSDPNEGLITTIYETAGSAAESVAGRISRRLANEPFHSGKKPLELNFRYSLTLLPVVINE
jgi:hypothetical protein